MDNEPTPETPDQQILRLSAEQVTVEAGQRVTGKVDVSVRTSTHTENVRAALSDERVVVDRVSVGAVVDELPQQRQEGDTTIIPVVEEIVEVRKRYLIREEVRIQRIIEHRIHEEAVDLRREEATVHRTAFTDQPDEASRLADSQPGDSHHEQ
ncbi:YsnF/AvaK domain-containing protein [Tanticharoenia sakaeratensis]|uniref:YsnF/AvaK domain-containing protein n=1 Tax=Tanticharoenia sakaeratensis TaxID=444053 RepID=UPI00130D5E39|nr:YsnF/AvaK domain-containing protein [Tanticharoenia sakaeratensis]GBQ17796.1 hypothetical protein AA103193_0481 [Tanticharoenia sakaeratensis NBRC 103193]